MVVHEECVLCGNGIIYQDGQSAKGLVDLETNDEVGGVCDTCVTTDLNSGDVLGECVLCGGEPKYGLETLYVKVGGTHASKRASGTAGGILCEEDYQLLREEQ